MHARSIARLFVYKNIYIAIATKINIKRSYIPALRSRKGGYSRKSRIKCGSSDVFNPRLSCSLRTSWLRQSSLDLAGKIEL